MKDDRLGINMSVSFGVILWLIIRVHQRLFISFGYNDIDNAVSSMVIRKHATFLYRFISDN